MKVRNQKKAEKLEIPMTPMIDVVFQLLVFFIMTFKIVSPEGDFNIKMPAAASSQEPSDPVIEQIIKIRIQADGGGNVASITMGGIAVNSLDALRDEVLRTVQTSSPEEQGAEWEVELDCDYDLHYTHVITAIDAVTGRVTEDGQVERIVEKFKFAQPRPAG